jgi:hypothetical protein
MMCRGYINGGGVSEYDVEVIQRGGYGEEYDVQRGCAWKKGGIGKSMMD